jgi:plasmid stabilization system protein ParE
VVLTPAATADLEGIWDFIAEDSPPAARAVTEDILNSITKLTDFPLMGHPRTDLADETLRVWPVHSYLIIYRPTLENIEILRVVSGFRDLLALFP